MRQRGLENAGIRGRPRVIVHVAVALDGATTGFPADVGRFYELAATWREDVTLAGADTVLAQEAALRAGPAPGPATGAATLAVIDGRARVSAWQALREAGYWSDVIALRCAATPPHPDPGVAEVIAGTDRVDLAEALRALGERGAEVVRVDSGGSLIAALLKQGLVDEVSLLVHPCLSDGTGRPWYGDGSAARSGRLELSGAQAVDQLVWLCYRLT